MYGFVIAVMLCSGTNCDLIQAEPEISYPSYEACNTARSSKTAALQALADKHASADRPARIICLHPIDTIVEVEQPYQVLDTAMVHKEPAASSLFVGLVEKGQRTLVTGLVAGTDWVRVLLPDGKTGYVFADRLRKIGEEGGRTAAAPSATPPAPAPAPAPPAVAKPPAAPAPPPVLATAPPSPPPATPAPTSAGVGSKEFRDCDTCPVMVTLPAGSFEMGSNGDPSERPPHKVALRPFALSKFEVTAAEWQACVAAQACSYKPATEASPERRPVANLSWSDASQYVQWLQKTTGKPYRLPSEAEWEYAAAAGATGRYGWGDQPAVGKADCKGCGGPHDDRRPADVGAYAANAWGLHDMEGGVAEWVDDCWHSSYQGAPADGSAWHAPNCQRHVLRGGSWMNPPADITLRSRNFYDTNVRYVANGMRVALTLP